jgi:hypothetical protein
VLLALALAPQAHAQIDSRDTLIDELRRRVDALEKRVNEPPPAPPAAPQAPPAKPPAQESAEKDESARALERALVREGGLVLPAGTFEVDPRLQYTYRGSDALGIVNIGGVAQVAEQDLKRNEVEASLGIRVGLPWSSQVELRLPYVWLHQNRAIGSTQSESERVSGGGDVELGFDKQLLTERGARPSVLASLNWKTASGRHEFGRLSPGSGFHQLQAAATAVKRQDPLVFFGSLSYTAALERTRGGSDVDPGDAIGIKAGALLAASPETSLRAGFELSRFGRTEIGGRDAAGSDATVAMLDLGFASLISRRVLLDLQLAVGLTPDSPDFQLRLSLPIRF